LKTVSDPYQPESLWVGMGFLVFRTSVMKGFRYGSAGKET
jgi:hypothetical protein